MKSKEYNSIIKMIEYINKALKYTAGCSFEEFCSNEEKVDATVFVISQIGELVKNISSETMCNYSNIEWIIIKNLRNKIVHDYEGIKLNFIWDIITNDLIKLKIDLEQILTERNKLMANKNLPKELDFCLILRYDIYVSKFFSFCN